MKQTQALTQQPCTSRTSMCDKRPVSHFEGLRERAHDLCKYPHMCLLGSRASSVYILHSSRQARHGSIQVSITI